MNKVKNKRRHIIIVSILAALIFFALALIIINPFGPKYYDSGYFKYTVRGEEAEQTAWIEGLTDLGKEQTQIIVPEVLDGYQVSHLGWSVWGFSHGIWESDNLKKVYVPFELDIDDEVFRNCTNLEKVITLYEINTNFEFIYYPNASCYTNYNIQKANISFKYNYDDAENYGFYWIDDLDYGSLITTLPENPTREGYTFDGWYKELECVNQWNFETDVTPTATYETDGTTLVYQETILYAKWI